MTCHNGRIWWPHPRRQWMSAPICRYLSLHLSYVTISPQRLGIKLLTDWDTGTKTLTVPFGVNQVNQDCCCLECCSTQWWRGLQSPAKFNLSFQKQPATSTMESGAERKR